MNPERQRQLQEESLREKKNRELSRKASEEGIVLLKNNGVLPLAQGSEAALFGSGAIYTLKGGTGSGDVNERRSVSIYEGMEDAGFRILNTGWLRDYQEQYEADRKARYESLNKLRGELSTREWIWMILTDRLQMPVGRALTPEEKSVMQGKTAVYVIARQAGEGGDKKAEKGDYFLSDLEVEEIKALREVFNSLILILNCGGPVDLHILDEVDIDAVVFVAQPGMEGGAAVANILSGAAVPSGRLTDTWAMEYTDYPSAAAFNAREDAVELYSDGIYVGYRYFDTFGVKPRFPFGFGLSYTDFELKYQSTWLTQGENGPQVNVQVQVQNIGKHFPGKEVVQLYVHCPAGKLDKEYKRLVAFAKTPDLKPGESCTVSMIFDAEAMVSFAEEKHAYVLEAGDYVLLMGTCSDAVSPVAKLRLPEEVTFGRMASICPLQMKLDVLKGEEIKDEKFDAPVIDLDPKAFVIREFDYTLPDIEERVSAFVDTLSVEQMTLLVNGNPNRAQGVSNTIGSSGRSVPGSAGESSGCAMGEPWNLNPIVTADGPAGLRLSREYYLQPNGTMDSLSLLDEIEKKISGKQRAAKPGETTVYQHCTAFPVGILLAQTWNPELLEQVGEGVSLELEEYKVHVWLAPGLNIHRNPLQGRNFEYFSEDPVISGCMAAAITRGVQKTSRRAATIKHFVCNQRENDRKQSDSVVTERALREIYLRGFEIAVKQSAPVSLMSSYNLINGVHAANSNDLLTKVLRCEWGYQGFVMTDWTTTGEGGSLPEECMRAGNDLIMPGTDADAKRLRECLNSGRMDFRDLKRCAARVVKAAWHLNT